MGDDLDWTLFPLELGEPLRRALGGRARGFVHVRVQDAFSDSPNANAALDVAVIRNVPKSFGLGDIVDVNASIELEDDEVTAHRVIVNGGGDELSFPGSTMCSPPKQIYPAF